MEKGSADSNVRSGVDVRISVGLRKQLSKGYSFDYCECASVTFFCSPADNMCLQGWPVTSHGMCRMIICVSQVRSGSAEENFGHIKPSQDEE